MKRLLLSAMALFMSIAVSNAQKTTTRLEVAGDWTKLNHKVKDNSIKSIMDFKDVGLRASFGAEYNLGRSVYIYSGLNYKLENSTNTESLLPSITNIILPNTLPIDGLLKKEDTSTLHYLSIPVNLGTRIRFGSVGLSAEVGPYFSYGIKGQISSTIQSELFKSEYLNKLSKEEQEALNLLKNKYGSYDPFKSNGAKEEPFYKRIDFGIGAGLAIEYSIFYLRVGTDFGLYNLSNIKDFDIKKHNVYAGLGLRF